MKFSYLPSWIAFIVVNFNYVPFRGGKNCQGFGECVVTSGYTCKDNKCVCDPHEPGFFRCIRMYYGQDESAVKKGSTPRYYGERCNLDQECELSDYNLNCLKGDIRICKCKRGFIWDMERKKCLPTLDDDMYSGKFEPVRDLVIPGLIVMTIGAMVYLGFKLFCNCGKLWRRRRHQEIARELEEIRAAPHQQAWIASYRVFSPYNNSNRASGLSPTSFPLHPPPCMGLFVPSQSLLQSPPPYEEALKHKVILSSYHNPGPPVAAYTVPAPDIPRQYQTLPASASGCTGAVLTASGPNGCGGLKCGGHRSYSGTQNEICPNVTSEWSQIQCVEDVVPGNAGATRNPQGTGNPEVGAPGTEGAETGAHHPRLPPIEVWTPPTRNSQMLLSQPRGGIYRPGQPQKIYHGSGSPRNGRCAERST